MLISVVIPTYNRRCIIDCLEALRSQINIKKEDYEVVVVTRGLPEYLKDYFNNIAPNNWKLFPCSLSGNGPAKNAAVENYAEGSFIAFTDDDCLPNSNWISQLYKAQQITNADIVVGIPGSHSSKNPYLVAHQQHIIYYLTTLANYDPKYPTLLKDTVCGTTMNMLIRKVTFKMLGGFDPAFSKHYGDDRLFNIKWAADANIRAVFNPFASVAHNHPFTFKSFLRLSFRYGTGINKCREVAKKQGYKEVPSPPARSEYMQLVKFSLNQRYPKRWYVALLIIISQEVKRIGMWYGKHHPEYSSKGY